MGRKGGKDRKRRMVGENNEKVGKGREGDKR